MSSYREHYFERDNATQWETESNISASFKAPFQSVGRQTHSTPSAPTCERSPIQTLQPSITHMTPNQFISSRESASGHCIPHPQPPLVNTYPTGPKENHRPRSQPQQRQGNPNNSRGKRQSHRPANAGWAETPGLVTTRKAIFNTEEALKIAEFDLLRSRPESNERFAATGYYLWPKSSKDPMSLFDPTLKAFDKLRIAYKVHIDWSDKKRCLRINCNDRGAETNVADAIKGIKVLQLNAQAQVISASPEYIIVPPTADAMRAFVRPKVTEHRETFINPVVTRIELTGERLSATEKLEWEDYFRQMKEANYRTFQAHLIDRTLPLGDLRGWMRMRVHIGHVNLSQYQEGFVTGKYNFESFVDMMKKPRVATGGTFDRKMDAAVVMNLIKQIESREQDFCPAKSTTFELSDVLAAPKHTEIMFVTTPDGLKHRLEAEIESAYVQSVRATGKYQVGHTRLFANDRRNKRMEITSVDVESEFDWTVEVIQDGEIKKIPNVLKQCIAASLDPKKEELVDLLNLPYPAIALKTPTEFFVQSVVIRSVFQYMWINSMNIIEIAIYREWDGCNTQKVPVMHASVSMFNPDWDSEMVSIENHTEGRNWDPQLHNFFGKDGVSHVNQGLKGLVHEIRQVQGLLTEAARVCSPIQKTFIHSGASTPPQEGLLDI